jgi:hypothetical protein
MPEVDNTISENIKEHEEFLKRNAEFWATLPPETQIILPAPPVVLPVQTVDWKTLLTTTYDPARFVINPFFEAGALNMMSAPPNSWKSWLILYFAVHIARGSPVWDRFEVEQSAVMIINEEDSLRRLKDRFEIMSIEDTDLPIYFRVANGAKLHKKYVDEIIRECKEKKIRVVMFDSLRSIHEASENDSTEMQKVMEFLKCISRENITVVFTHHHKKRQMFQARGAADQEQSRGSSGINAAINGHISLEEKTGDDGQTYIVISHLKAKDSEKLPPFEIRVIKEGGHISFGYCGEQKDNNAQKEIAKNKILIRLEDHDTWISAKEIYAWKFAAEKPTRQALKELEGAGQIHSRMRSPLEKEGKVERRSSSNPREVFWHIDEEFIKEKNLQEQFYDDV